MCMRNHHTLYKSPVTFVHVGCGALKSMLHCGRETALARGHFFFGVGVACIPRPLPCQVGRVKLLKTTVVCLLFLSTTRDTGTWFWNDSFCIQYRTTGQKKRRNQKQPRRSEERN